MSFILDALKKSESERQRQSGPALFEVRIAPPRVRMPLWSIVVAVLLGVNALVVGAWLLVRSARTAAAPPPAAEFRSPAAPAPAGASAVPAATSAGALPASPTVARHPSAPRDPELAALDAAPADPVTGSGVGPDDSPATVGPASAAVTPPPAPSATRDSAPGVRIQSTGLPTRDELHSPAIAALPELRLDLHVYDSVPAKRFVLINMHRLREGDSLPEGVRVDQITPEGAELEFNGERFLLPRE